MRRTDSLVKAWRVPGTSTLMVNGRLLIDSSMLSSWDERQQLVDFRVGLEHARPKTVASLMRGPPPMHVERLGPDTRLRNYH